MRRLLLALLAACMALPAGQISVSKGVVRHEASQRQASFGELIRLAQTLGLSFHDWLPEDAASQRKWADLSAALLGE